MEARVVEQFRARFGRDPEVVVRAPGRVNLLGAHIDYNEGWVLPAAIDLSLWLAAAPSGEPRLRAYSETVGEAGGVPLDPPPSSPQGQRSRDRWVDYPSGVAWALGTEGYSVCGMDAVVMSEIPLGAGLSSSAALEVAFLLAWCELSGLPLGRPQLARLGEKVENEYLNVQSGVMDQFASLHGRRGSAIYLGLSELGLGAAASSAAGRDSDRRQRRPEAACGGVSERSQRRVQGGPAPAAAAWL